MRRVAACIAFCLPLASIAAVADCATIAKAMIAVEAAPGVRQKTFASETDGGALLAESLKLADAMYLREGDQEKWRRVPFDAAQRKDKAEKMLKVMPLSDCSGPRAQDDGASAVQVYDFVQPDPLKAGATSRSAVWLDGEGRVRRLVLDDGAYQTFEYGAFDAPATAPARPAKAK